MEADANDPFIMTIYMANNKRSATLGRQLWATFNIGTQVEGCMRFIPLPENSKPKYDVAEFEKACKLKKDVWPGDAASEKSKNISYPKWGLRWRARHASGDKFEFSDTIETMFTFNRDEEGKLELRGVWAVSWQPHLWRAVKVEDGAVPSAVDASVSAQWKKYASN